MEYNLDLNTRHELAEYKLFSAYLRKIDGQNRKETWNEAVDRVFNQTYITKYKDIVVKNAELRELIEFAREAYRDKLVLASQRILQFGGPQILKHEMKVYNCTTSYCDRPRFFQECMYILLAGSGVGFSVQYKHHDKLPLLIKRSKATKTFQIPDSIEGWADAIGVIISSFLSKDHATFPDFAGKTVHFDYSLIRPEGALISGGFKAPGPNGLKNSLEKIEALLSDVMNNQSGKLRTIDSYDIVMHLADAVLSGGVRRSATICLFSVDDELMMKAKTGYWFTDNPQRARSNNSAVLVRSKVTFDQFKKLVDNAKIFGEPGFVFTEDEDTLYNPCVEIGMRPQTEDGQSGWQGCNLTEISGKKCTSKEIFFRAYKASAIMGTLQAGFTNFKYVDAITKKIFDREALLGCSVTGWLSQPDILLDEKVQREGAHIIKHWNKIVAEMLGINQAARNTCSKPAGNTAILTEDESGVTPAHSRRLIRHVQANKNETAAQVFKDINPNAVENSVWSSSGTDFCLAFPIVNTGKELFKSDIYNVKHLEIIKSIQQNWIEEGTNVELCTKPYLRHNVSNTVDVDDWDVFTKYVYENRQWFAGISTMARGGDRNYNQAPNTAVYTPQEMVEMYGSAAIFASGLIVDALEIFDTLWVACDTVLDRGEKLTFTDEEVEKVMNGTDIAGMWIQLKADEEYARNMKGLGVKPPKKAYKQFLSDDLRTTTFKFSAKVDWIRRAKQFAINNFEGDLEKMTYCLKDVQNYHKWVKICRGWQVIDWSKVQLDEDLRNADTMGAAACSGPDGCVI